MTLENKIPCPSMIKPSRGKLSVLARGWTFLSRLLVVMRGSPRFLRYENCRWCDSTERQLNNEIMFGRSTRFSP